MKTPDRTCAGCGKRRPKREMIRVGLDREGRFFVGGVGKVGGRGGYLCCDRKCVVAARGGRSLDRAMKARVPGAVYDEVEMLCGKRE